jgi:hypothetical protein
MGSYMEISIKSIIVYGCLSAVISGSAACSPRRIPPASVADLLDDRVMLDGVLLKCNQNPSKARTDSECQNARVAVERLASQSEPARQAKRTEEFEQSREKLRLAQERQRQEQEAKTKVDAYHLPLVPDETAPPAPPPDGATPPVARRTSP